MPTILNHQFYNKSFNRTVRTHVCIINHYKELSGHMISSLHHRGIDLSESQCPGPVSHELWGWEWEPWKKLTADEGAMGHAVLKSLSECPVSIFPFLVSGVEGITHI